MTKEKLKSVLAYYKTFLIKIGAKSVAANYNKIGPTNEEGINHSLSIIPRAETLIEDNRIGKAFRWLGFIQGVLWMAGKFSLNQLMDHGRTDDIKK